LPNQFLHVMKTILSGLILLICLTSSAQKRFELFYLGGNANFPDNTTAKEDENKDISFFTNLSIPIVLKDSSVWFTSLDYQYDSFNNTFLTSEINRINRFNIHGFMMRTGYIKRFNAKTSLQMLLIPRYMTDGKAGFSESIQLGGIVMYEKVKNKNHTWRTGLLYNNELFGTYLVPLYFLDWKISSKFKANGLLPIYGKVYYEPSEKLNIGVHFIGLTKSFAIKENEQDYYIERKTVDLSFFTKVHLFNNVFLEARGGYSLTRDAGLYAKGDKVDLSLPLAYVGNNRTRLNEKMEGSPFAYIRLLYSIKVD